MGRLKILALIAGSSLIVMGFYGAVLDDFETAVMLGFTAVVAAVLSLAEN